MPKKAALPVATSTLNSSIESVRRLQRPGPASPPTSSRLSRPSADQEGGAGVGMGVGVAPGARLAGVGTGGDVEVMPKTVVTVSYVLKPR